MVAAPQIEDEVSQRVMRQSARVSARLARILFLLAADQGERTSGGYRVTLPFTQEELAAIQEDALVLRVGRGLTQRVDIRRLPPGAAAFW